MAQKQYLLKAKKTFNILPKFIKVLINIYFLSFMVVTLKTVLKMIF